MSINHRRPSLTELANQFGSDKGTVGPSDHWQALNYTDIYAAYLEPLRDKPLRLLEIGIGATGDQWDARIVHGRNKGGASIRMWAEYFTRAEIVAIDINPATYLDNDRIRTYVIDQSNEKELRDFTQKEAIFDIIIDDGSHHPAHQQLTLSILFQLIKKGGLYIIEDLDDNGMNDPIQHVRSHGQEVLNTREILKSFQNTGKVPAPHAFLATQFLDDVTDLQFHCPEIGTKTTWQLFPPKKRTVFDFRSNSEHVCVLRKA